MESAEGAAHDETVRGPELQKPGVRALDGRFDIYRLPGAAPIPEHLLAAKWVWIARTEDELSIVCPPDESIAKDAVVSADWAAIQVVGPIEHSVVGLLADLARTLAEQGITVFAQSTFDTDYVLVRAVELHRALGALRAAGYPAG